MGEDWCKRVRFREIVKDWEWGLTSLSLVGVSQLLQATTDLFSGPALASGTIDIFGDELVAHWKSTEETRFSTVLGLVALEA